MNVAGKHCILFTLPGGAEADPALVVEIRKALPHATERRLEVDLEADGRRLRLTARDTEIDAGLERTLGRFLEDMTRNYAPVRMQVLRAHEAAPPKGRGLDIYAELLARGWIMEVGPGFAGFRGPALALFRALDRSIRTLYGVSFAAEEVHFPSLLPTSDAAACGYFDSYPHHINFVAPLAPDYCGIETFRQRHGKGDALDEIATGSLAVPHVCLNPAACLCCYPQYRGRELMRGETIQWLGRVHRFEATNVSGLRRLWEYNVREIVFLGLPEFAQDARAEALDHLETLFRDLGLGFGFEVATDPFFAPVRNEKQVFQSAMQTKYEIVMRAGEDPGEQIAVGSLNLHQDFFGGSFDISTPGGDVAHTACVGIGIERLMAAFLYQHGLDPENWPEAARDRMGQGGR